MREILFRGKRMDNGKWVEGSLLKVTINGKTAHLIFGDNFSLVGNDVKALSHALVDPATVGQYTGLTDKNGQKIFEGDVVSIEDGEFWVFSFGNCGGVQNVAHEVGYTGFHLSPLSPSAIHNRDYGQRDDPAYYLNAIGLCVIGNIHDNPELLEVAP